MNRSPLIAELEQASKNGIAVRKADLSNIDASGCDFTRLIVDRFIAENANFQNARFVKAQLVESDFTASILNNANFESAIIGLSDFNQTSMLNVCLRYSLFLNAYCIGSKLDDADLTGSDLECTFFSNSSLDRALLIDVNARYGGFYQAKMVQANLRGGSFVKATFSQADLTNADLSSGDFSNADFRGAILDGVCWTDAILTNATFDDSAHPY